MWYEEAEKLKDISKIKWMCYDVFITADKQVFNMDLYPVKEQTKSGCYGYKCNGMFRSKKWINEHCINVEGFVNA